MSPWECRRAELHQIWLDDPAKLIGIFRRASGLDEFGRLPDGATVATIIEAILDREEASGKMTDDQRRD